MGQIAEECNLSENDALEKRRDWTPELQSLAEDLLSSYLADLESVYRKMRDAGLPYPTTMLNQVRQFWGKPPLEPLVAKGVDKPTHRHSDDQPNASSTVKPAAEPGNNPVENSVLKALADDGWESRLATVQQTLEGTRMNLVERFHELVSASIDQTGVYPAPGMAIDKDGKLRFASIMEPHTAYQWFWDQVANKEAQEVIIGLDRSTKDGQGTEFADVLTCAHWKEGLDGKAWHAAFRIGVINYQNEPRIVREFDFDNEFWSKQVTEELLAVRPEFRLKVVTEQVAIAVAAVEAGEEA